MDFLPRLRRYLERVGQAPDGLPYVTIDVAAHKRFLLETIEREWGHDPDQANHLRRTWSDIPLEVFIQWLAIGILDEVEPETTTTALGQLINKGIAIGLDSKKTIAEASTLDRLLMQKVDVARLVDDLLTPEWWQFPPLYAFENRLVSRRNKNVTLSRCGQTFLEAPGIDGAQWLLTLETAQSLGTADELRMAAERVTQVVQWSPHFEYPHSEDYTATQKRIPLATIRRLAAFGFVDYEDGNDDVGYEWGYSVIARHLPLLEEIAQRKSTPYAILADALLRDETTNLVERAHPQAARVPQESAAATYALQARMVVHEIRNALLPAQVAFASMATQLSSDDEALQKRRTRVEGGIQRALEFVDNMLRVANLGVEQPSTFDIAGALRDACVSLSRELNGGFQQYIDITDASVRGPRGRFVLAVTNLLRNAAQSIAGLAGGRVSLTTERDTVNVLIHVDDNGPGVPETNRRLIFEPGVTLRPGGSGQGLALVQQVVEGEMFGRVTCSNAPLGGARFTIQIPLQSRAG